MVSSLSCCGLVPWREWPNSDSRASCGLSQLPGSGCISDFLACQHGVLAVLPMDMEPATAASAFIRFRRDKSAPDKFRLPGFLKSDRRRLVLVLVLLLV